MSGFIATPTSAAEAGCRVDCTVNQWAGGYTAQVKATNLGPAVNGWRLTWTHADGQRVTSAWNATVTQTGASVVAVNTGWNGSLATGGSAEFGVQGTWSSAVPAPTDFALNGVVCGGTGTTPPPTTPHDDPQSAIVRVGSGRGPAVTTIRCAGPAEPAGSGSRRPAGPSGPAGGGTACGG
ncbi:cellulose binding domain-containing protein [Streptomyces sp. NPDC056817]|uniref:cellulose binding domain-containing protein n=1 Tax=Streptomyces sp. NPDC056817 TaxID=3345950 RepID=UPI0036CBAEC8